MIHTSQWGVCVEPFGALPSCLVLGIGARTDKGIAGFQLTGFALRDYNLRILDQSDRRRRDDWLRFWED